MSGTYTLINEHEMRTFLEAQGFREIKLDRTKEIVYSKLLAPQTCLRVYTSVAYGASRDCGQDAIRVCVVYKLPSGEIKPIGKDAKVYRIETWKKNLQSRLDKWLLQLGPPCKCGAPTKEREGKFGKFWGCVSYPACKEVTR